MRGMVFASGTARSLHTAGLLCRTGPPALGVPGDAGNLLLAGFPFGAREDPRGDVDQSRYQPEDSGRAPGTTVSCAIVAYIQGIGHAGEGDVLNDELCEEFKCLRFERVVFEVVAVRGDTQAERDFFR